MVDDAHHDRSGPDPAPPPFDSMANLRALGDIQRRGLEAANLVIGRLMDPVDGGGPLFGAEPPRAQTDDGVPGPGPEAADLVAQSASLMSSFFGALLGNGAPHTAGAGAHDPPAPVWADPLILSSVAAGGRSQGELWLHNRSGAAVTDVRLHCGDLRRHDGRAIASTTVTFDPAQLEELPDLTSRGIRASVDVPADARAGTYRGTVLATNLATVWLVVELEVVAGP